MDEKLSNILMRIFDLKTQEIEPSLNQVSIANWDSLTHMDLISTIEKEYCVTLSMEDIMEMTSILGILNVLKKTQVVK